MEAFLRSENIRGWTKPKTGDVRVPSTLRAAATLTGFRVPAGHLFWLMTLQYYGNSDNRVDRYSKLLDYCLLASDLNPHFVKIYEFGAAVLAFHVWRADEAVILLQRGIEENPKAIRLKLLLAAIGYQNTEQYDKIIPLLETQIASGSTHPMLAKILANTYKKVGRVDEAIRLWKQILRKAERDDDRDQAARALEAIYLQMKSQKTTKDSP